MRRPGEVVSKIELLDHVWDAGAGHRAERGRGLHRIPAPQDRPGPAGDRPRRRVPAGPRRRRAEHGRLRRLSLRARLLLVSVRGALPSGWLAGGVVAGGRARASRCCGPSTTEALRHRRRRRPAGRPGHADRPDPGQPGAPGAGRRRSRAGCGRCRPTADRLVPILYPDELRRLRRPASAGDPRRPDRLRRAGAGGDGRRRPAATQPLRSWWPAPPPTLTQGVHLLRITLLIAFPLLVALLAAVAWRVLGRGAAAGRGAAGRGRGDHRRRPGPAGCRCPTRSDEIHRLAVTLNDMLDRLERPGPGSGRSSPTPRTSCAAR